MIGKFKWLWIFSALFALAIPGSALALYKPSRVVLPELFGVECFQNRICIDDKSRMPEAVALTEEAIDFVNQKVGVISQHPRIIYCSTQKCADSFGQFHAAAYCVGTVGIVIRTKGWEEHFVRHELIHHLQNERFGSLHAYLFLPNWYKEGMAYSLSGDPRRPIPSLELEGYRHDFEAWAIDGKIWERGKSV